MSARIREQAFRLGPRQSLLGLVTESVDPPPAADRPTFVILNAGIIHRVGPSRMSVLLARALAAEGHRVLRFDLSGLGDSQARPDGLAPFEAALADVREALDWLEASRGANRFVLVGLCSGADHSLLYGGRDPRVRGLVLIDPSTPRTRQYYLRHYGPRLFRPRIWYNVMLGRHARVRRLAARLAGRDEGAAAYRPDLQSPEVRAVLEGAYRAALSRGVQFLMAFTSGLEEQHNYREQVLDAFPGVAFGNRLRLEYFEGAEHTFTSEVHRARLLRLVVDWAGSTAFSGPVDAG